MTTAKAYRIRDGVVYREVAAEVVVVRISVPEVVVLNDTGGRILTLIAAQADRDQIVDWLWSEYEVPRDELARAVDGFIGELEAGALIEAVTT